MSDLSALRSRLRPDGGILLALQMTQEAYGYVPEEALPVVVDVLNVSRAEVHGVLTYYSDLRREPPAPATVRICAGEACQAVGARDVHRALDEMQLPSTRVEHVFCLGNCALGPCAMVNGEVRGRVTADSIAHEVRDVLGIAPTRGLL